MNFGTFTFPKKSYDFDLDSNGVANLVAAGSIEAGDVVINNGFGVVALSPATAGTAANDIALPTLAAPFDAITPGAQAGCATLTSGNFVVAYFVSGTSVKFAQYTAAGVIVGSITTVEAANVQAVAVAPLTGGGFVVAYSVSSVGIRFGIYNASNTLVGSLVTAWAGSASGSVSVAGLATGGFVIAHGATSNTFFTQFNSSGVIVGATTSMEAGAAPANVSITRLASGNFVIANQVGSASVKFAQFNTSNALVGSVVTVDGASPTTGVAVLGLANGSFVVMNANGSGYMRVTQYNASNALTFGPQVINDGSASYGVQSLAQLTNGNILAVYGSSGGGVRCTQFDSNLRQAAPATVLAGAGLAGCGCAALASGSFAVGYVYTSGVVGAYFLIGSSALVAARYTGPGLLLDNTTNTPQLGIVAASSPAFQSASVGVATLRNGNTVYSGIGSNGSARFVIINPMGYAQNYGGFTVDITGVTSARVCALNDGTFVVAYTGPGGGSVRFARFTQDGIPIGASVLVETVSVGDVRAVALTSGNFVVLYQSASTVRAAQYTSAGVLVGAITVPVSASGGGFMAAMATAAGGYAVVVVNAATFCSTHTSTGTQIASFQVDAASTGNTVSMAQLSSGLYVIAFGSGTNTRFVISTESAIVGSSVVVEAVAVSNITGVVALPNGNFMMAYTNGTGLKIAQYNGPTLVGSVIQVLSAGNHVAHGTLAANGAAQFITSDGSTPPRVFQYVGAPRAVLGQALGAANAGQIVQVRYTGKNFQPASVLLPRSNGGQNIAFDHRAIGGISGVLAGNTMFLKGF